MGIQETPYGNLAKMSNIQKKNIESCQGGGPSYFERQTCQKFIKPPAEGNRQDHGMLYFKLNVNGFPKYYYIQQDLGGDKALQDQHSLSVKSALRRYIRQPCTQRSSIGMNKSQDKQMTNKVTKPPKQGK